jgi:hypothetical protein
VLTESIELFVTIFFWSNISLRLLKDSAAWCYNWDFTIFDFSIKGFDFKFKLDIFRLDYIFELLISLLLELLESFLFFIAEYFYNIKEIFDQKKMVTNNSIDSVSTYATRNINNLYDSKLTNSNSLISVKDLSKNNSTKSSPFKTNKAKNL